MDGDDLWSAAVTGDQDYHAKPTVKKQAVPSHNYSSHYDDQEYGNANKDYHFTDRPKMYSGKKSYEEGQYNYGDAQNDQPNSKRQNLFPPSHPSNTKRQNIGGQTTQQLASKKYFGDKRNKFNLTSLKGNRFPGNQPPGINQPGNIRSPGNIQPPGDIRCGNNRSPGDTQSPVGFPVNEATRGGTTYLLNKAPIHHDFGGTPRIPYNRNIPTSQKDTYDGPKLSDLHPNITKDGILPGLSHEDKVLFYNTRANSGTEHSKSVVEPESVSAQSAWEDYHRYHYVRKMPNEKEKLSNNKNNFHQGSIQDQFLSEDKFDRIQHQRTYEFVEERIKELYNESLKEKESGMRENNSFHRYDGPDRNTAQSSGRGPESFGRYCPGGWHGDLERDDRYGSREIDRDDRYMLRDREDVGDHGNRDELDGGCYDGRDGEDARRYGGRDGEGDRRYGGRDMEGDRRYTDIYMEDARRHDGRDVESDRRYGGRDEKDDRCGGRDGEDDGRYCGRDGEDSRRYSDRDREDDGYHARGDMEDRNRHEHREAAPFGNRNMERGSRFDDRSFTREDRFEEREPEKGDIYNTERDRRFEDNNGRFEKAYYILEKDKDPGGGCGGEKAKYHPVKGNRNRNSENPVEGNRSTYRDGQDSSHLQKYSKNDSSKTYFKRSDTKDDTIIPKKVGDSTRLGSSDTKDKHERKKTDKEHIKKMLIEAGDKSVMSFRKSRKRESSGAKTGAVSSSYAEMIGNMVSTMRRGTIQPPNPVIKYIVPLGNQPMVYPAGSISSRTPVSAPMNHDASNSAPNLSVSVANKDGTTVDIPPAASTVNVVSSGGGIIRGPSGNPLYHVANPPPNAVIRPLNSLMNSVPINHPLRFVHAPLQYVPPGSLPGATPNVPLIMRMPAPVLRHPLLSNVTIPPSNEPSFLSTQLLPQDLVQTNMLSMPRNNFPQVVKDSDAAVDNNNPQPLMTITVGNSIYSQSQMNLGSGLLPDPPGSQETKKECKWLVQNAIKQIDANKSADCTSKSKKFKINRKKPWFDYNCHVLHKKRLRKLARLKKARNQENEKEIEELKQAIREINREYLPLLRDRKSKYTAELESKGEIELLCEMTVTSLVDRVMQIMKMERKEAERLAAEGDSSENKDTSTNNSEKVIVIDDDHEGIEEQECDEIGGDEETTTEGVNDSAKEVIKIDIDEE